MHLSALVGDLDVETLVKAVLYITITVLGIVGYAAVKLLMLAFKFKADIESMMNGCIDRWSRSDAFDDVVNKARLPAERDFLAKMEREIRAAIDHHEGDEDAHTKARHKIKNELQPVLAEVERRIRALEGKRWPGAVPPGNT